LRKRLNRNGKPDRFAVSDVQVISPVGHIKTIEEDRIRSQGIISQSGIAKGRKYVH
jgi:hypothetical protein